MDKKVFLKGMTFLTSSRLIQEPTKLDIDFWFSRVAEYSDDDFYKAVMEITDHTKEVYPGTNIVALLIEKLDSVITGRERKIEHEQEELERTSRKLLAEKEATQRVTDAAEAEKRLATPEYQANLAKLDGDFSKYISAMTAETAAHCDKFIDRSKTPLNMKDLKEPWDESRINETRTKLRNETKAKAEQGKAVPA